MSTNYYLRHIPTEEECEQAKSLIDQKRYEAAITCLEKIRERIHVGKSSDGWKFSFQIAEDGIDMEGKDLIRKNAYKVIQGYIDRGYELEDEYEDKVTLSELVELIESKIHGKDGSQDDREIVKDGVRWLSFWYM